MSGGYHTSISKPLSATAELKVYVLYWNGASCVPVVRPVFEPGHPFAGRLFKCFFPNRLNYRGLNHWLEHDSLSIWCAIIQPIWRCCRSWFIPGSGDTRICCLSLIVPWHKKLILNKKETRCLPLVRLVFQTWAFKMSFSNIAEIVWTNCHQMINRWAWGLCPHIWNTSTLTHWGRNKWTPFRRRHFQMHFL